MRISVELRLFQAVVGLVLLIPLVAGPVGAFGGLEGLAALFGVDGPIGLAPSLRNHLRAICWMFFGYVPLVAWSLGAPVERAAVFRIVIVVAALAGLARQTGALVDGPPGAVAVALRMLEFFFMPALLLWHTRLVRRLRRPRPAGR